MAPSSPRSATYRARKVHRYLGLFIGLQFLLWTVGGLYFSWVSLDAVHGDHLHRPAPLLPGDATLASPAVALAALRAAEPVDSIGRVELVPVLGRPTYRVAYFTHGEGATAYVAAEFGEVVRIRNDRWRAFDFLWMLHTMDYQGRDDFNNLALRAFSVFGLTTVLSGFVLFALTSPVVRRRRA